MKTSPCRECAHLAQSKNKRRCIECEQRVAYVTAMDYDSVMSRGDHVHADLFMPRSFARQIGPVGSWCYADLIPT